MVTTVRPRALGVIGPNAVIQLVPALEVLAGAAAARRIFESSGASDWLAAPPREMVAEGLVAALHQQMRRDLDPRAAASVAGLAGRLTADYILAHRIPPLMRRLLPRLPAALAARLLLAAIARHAWTFAGSGAFAAMPGRPCVIEIAANPFVAGERAGAPLCAWHAAVFTQLFRNLVHPAAGAREVACCAAGAPACRFEVDWAAG